MESTGTNKTVVVVVAAAIGVLVGGLGGWWIADMNKMSTTTTEDSSMNMSKDQGDGTMVGGALMTRDKDIVDNAAAAKNVTTVVSLVKAAGLVETLKGEGPFTVFGPNNDAFAKIDKATVESLQKPENVEMLKKILTYHVVAGTYTSADLKVMAQKGEMLKTVEGEDLMPVIENDKVMIQDAMGGKAMIQTADVISSNGVTHVIESVLMPKS